MLEKLGLDKKAPLKEDLSVIDADGEVEIVEDDDEQEFLIEE